MITYAFDSSGRVQTVINGISSSTQSYASSILYAPHGATKQLTYGGTGGILEGVTFNSRLQPTSIGETHNSAAVLTLGYTYGTTDNNGNVRTHTVTSDATRTQTFGYDALNRLKTASESSGWSQTYVYDRYGNRAVLAGSWIPYANGTPTVADQLDTTVAAQFPSNRWSSGLTYDNGASNSVGLVTTSGTQSYTYDGENRLKTATNGSVFASYSYDADGRRVGKTDGFGTTVYVYDAQGKMAVEYFAPTAGATQPTQVETGTRYVIRDHLGSTRATTDAAAANVKYFDYLPFGEDIAQGNNGRGTGYPTGTSLNVPANINERFTGKERDTETGLDYFGARYMSSAQGRFTSPDLPFIDQHPDDPQSWNLYSYVRNNPLRYTDPTGRCLRPGETVSSCLDYLIGGAKAIGNIPSDVANLPNRASNVLIAPLTDYRFPDLVSPTFQPSNRDQADGMEAMQISMAASGIAETATAGIASGTAAVVSEAAPTGGRLGNAATRAQNASIADSLESRGFTVTGGGGRLPEEHLPGPGGGRQGGTFVDVTAVRDGRTVRAQTIDTRADGLTPTTREANAAARIRAQQKSRDHTVLIPKK